MIRDWAYNKYRKNQLLNMFVEKKNVNEPSAFSKYLKLKIKPKPEPILVFFVWFWFFCLFVSLRYFFVILSLFILIKILTWIAPWDRRAKNHYVFSLYCFCFPGTIVFCAEQQWCFYSNTESKDIRTQAHFNYSASSDREKSVGPEIVASYGAGFICHHCIK